MCCNECTAAWQGVGAEAGVVASIGKPGVADQGHAGRWLYGGGYVTHPGEGGEKDIGTGVCGDGIPHASLDEGGIRVEECKEAYRTGNGCWACSECNASPALSVHSHRNTHKQYQN